MERIVFKTFSSYVAFYNCDINTDKYFKELVYDEKSNIPENLKYTYYNKPFVGYKGDDRREIFILDDNCIIMFRKKLEFGVSIIRHQFISLETFKIILPELYSEYITLENIKLLETL